MDRREGVDFSSEVSYPIDPGICNQTFRGAGITAYFENPEAKLGCARQMAAHSDPNATELIR